MSPIEHASIAAGRQSREGSQGRLRILVCTPFPPRLDARHGGKATAQLLARLAARHDVGLLFLRAEGDDPVDDLFADRCAYVEEVALPRRLSARFAWSRRAAWVFGFLRGLPPWADDCRSAAYAARLRELAREWRPDVVELHLQVMAQYVSALDRCPAPTILVDYDPPTAWAAELMRLTRGPRRLVRRLEVAVWRQYEQRTRRSLEAIVVFAERDLAAASSTSGGVPVAHIPLAFEIPEKPLDPVGQPPPTVLFFGGFGHPPNVDAARWLAASLFPRVLERVPEARLELVGDRPSEEVLRLAGGAVSVHGSVPEMTPYLDRAAVVVAPIRLGGSMRGKVLESLAAGKAVVATPRAAEGIKAADGEEFVLGTTDNELVDGLVALLTNVERRRDLARRAREWAVENVRWERSVGAFEQLYDSLLRS